MGAPGRDAWQGGQCCQGQNPNLKEKGSPYAGEPEAMKGPSSSGYSAAWVGELGMESCQLHPLPEEPPCPSQHQVNCSLAESLSPHLDGSRQ